MRMHILMYLGVLFIIFCGMLLYSFIKGGCIRIHEKCICVFELPHSNVYLVSVGIFWFSSLSLFIRVYMCVNAGMSVCVCLFAYACSCSYLDVFLFIIIIIFFNWLFFKHWILFYFVKSQIFRGPSGPSIRYCLFLALSIKI